MSATDELNEALELALLHRDSLNYFTNGQTTAIGAMSAALADRGYVVVTKRLYNDLIESRTGPIDALEQYFGG